MFVEELVKDFNEEVRRHIESGAITLEAPRPDEDPSLADEGSGPLPVPGTPYFPDSEASKIALRERQREDRASETGLGSSLSQSAASSAYVDFLVKLERNEEFAETRTNSTVQMYGPQGPTDTLVQDWGIDPNESYEALGENEDIAVQDDGTTIFCRSADSHGSTCSAVRYIHHVECQTPLLEYIPYWSV